MEDNIFCTILTPTYNRANYLIKLFKSLCKQSDKNFEWIIVDDGSTDRTEEYVKKILKNTEKFNITYIKQNNGGKHRAINRGIENAKGEVFAIVDSDDFLTPNAIEKMKYGFDTIQNKDKFAGVAFQKGYDTKSAIGSTFKTKYVDCKSNERTKNNIKGDKFEIFYTRILRNNLFPEIEEETFIPEALVWTRIANNGFKLRWFNDIIYIAQYLDGGLTDKRNELVIKNPKGYALYIREQVKYGNITFKQKMGFYSYYYTLLKDRNSIQGIANILQTNVANIKISYMLRVFIKKMRRLYGK